MFLFASTDSIFLCDGQAQRDDHGFRMKAAMLWKLSELLSRPIQSETAADAARRAEICAL